MSAESNAWTHVEQFRWWRGNPDMSEHEAALRDAVALFNEAYDLLSFKGQQAHDAGMSWAEIGEITGMTRQAAGRRFGNPKLRGRQPVAPDIDALKRMTDQP